jgi:hypothetical protein
MCCSMIMAASVSVLLQQGARPVGRKEWQLRVTGCL